MLGLGVWELSIIFVIVLVLFGGKRLPSIATGLGQAINNFRSALKDENKETNPKTLENKSANSVDQN